MKLTKKDPQENAGLFYWQGNYAQPWLFTQFVMTGISTSLPL